MKSFKTLYAASVFVASVGFAQAQQNICQGEVTKLGLSANAQGATIQWQESATGTSFTNISGQTSDTLTITISGSAFYRAEIIDGSCDPFYSDTIEVNMVIPPTASNAGKDTSVSGTSVNLYANTPAIGSGTWAIVSGAGGSLTTPASPVSAFSGNANTNYILTWTVANPPCDPSIDTIEVTFSATVTLPSITCNSQTLYIHPTDNAGPTAWGCSGQVAGASSATDGQTNTATIVSVCGTNTAANVCASLTSFGFSDWYLPAYDELDCMRTNATSIGGFSSGAYWSSTEGTAPFTANARYRTFPTGVSGYGSKSNTNRIRCVRK